MRRRVKLWSVSLLVLVSLTMSRGGEPATLSQQTLPHHPPHDAALIHSEMATSTVTRTADWGISKTTIRSSPHLVAPVIDGAETPGLIPDDVALRIVFGTNALPASPSAKELARVNSKLARLGLDTQDLRVLTEELRVYHSVSAEQKERVANIRRSSGGTFSPTTWSALVQEDQALSRLAVTTYDRLVTSLSPAGALRLQEHVAKIKREIKISPPPKMSH